MRKHSRLSLLSSLLCVLALLLSACGDIDVDDIIPPTAEKPDKPDEALEEFENQEVSWAACDPTLFSESGRELLAPLGDRLECATLKTPLDWEEPARDEINLGVLRVKAGDESKRKGAILLNPGGPGGDGLTLGAFFGLIFANGGIEDTLPVAAPEILAQVSESYDIVGFSPRGVGGSFQLFCGSNAVYPPADFYTDRSDENLQALLAQAELVAEACKNNPLSDFVNTEQTVQDMDLIRRLLGDEKLNYLGYSYGSWLGAWYAKRFPENAGHMVLDANTNFAATFQESFGLQPLGFQRGFEDVAAPYLTRNDVFGLGETPEEVYGVYDALRDDVKSVVTFPILNLLYSSQQVTVVGASLSASRGINTILNELESPLEPEGYDAFLEAVATYPYVEDEELSAAISEVALPFAQDYIAALEAEPESVVLEPSSAVFNSISCNDSPWNQDSQFWIDFGNEQNEVHPFIGGAFTSEPCAFWGEPSTMMPDIPENLPSVLMVQTGYDAATPAEGALEAFESLPGAKLVYVENELSHTIFPYNTECVDAQVAQFLLDGSLPEETVTNCDALPLPGETEIFAPGTAPSTDELTTQGLVRAAVSAGENELYDLTHELLRENAAAFFGHARD